MAVKYANGVVQAVPVGNRAYNVAYVWVQPKKCVTLYAAPVQYKRCGVVNAYWWAIPANGYWNAKQTSS